MFFVVVIRNINLKSYVRADTMPPFFKHHKNQQRSLNNDTK